MSTNNLLPGPVQNNLASMSTDLKMFTACVVGCGRAGFTYDLDPKRKKTYTHFSMYSKSEKIEKVIAIDTNKKTLKKVKSLYPDTSCYTSLKKALDEEKIDIVSICTPSNLRYDLIEMVVKSGVKAIFCEKPISISIEEGQKIIDLCKKNNVLLTINYFRRWDQFHIDIADFLKENRLGEIKNITLKYTNGVVNTGSHAFDLINMLFGKITSIEANRVKIEEKDDPTLDVVVELESKNKVHMYGFDKEEDFRIFELDVIGTLGRIVIHNGYEADYYNITNSKRNSEFKILTKKDSLFKNGRQGHYENAIKNIINAIESKEPLMYKATDALGALQCSLVAIESSNKGKKIVF